MQITVKRDDVTAELSKAFDYEFDGTTSFDPPKIAIPNQFDIGLIVGPSGSGKTTILDRIGVQEPVRWNPEMAICSHFASATEAKEKLAAVGLNSVPVWMKPYHVLSNGEKFRADLSRRLYAGALIDEFTSVVDRSVAKSCAFAVQRHIRNSGLQRIIFATCHYDVAEWLMPDWSFDTSTGLMTGRGSKCRPEIELEVVPVSAAAWPIFRSHHYLSGDINKSARCWIATWDGVPVGFAAALAFPNRNFKNAWRGHRTVVLPEYQGLGLGVRISDAVAEMMLSEGKRYFSKTANPRMGAYRNASGRWKPTTKNMRDRQDYRSTRKTKESAYKHRHVDRVCYSHEYIGESERPK